jgi:creatinine amidohydrolase
MQWEQLTSDDFARAVKDTGVCLLSLGVVERHGRHLPLGTDFLNGHAIACLAAEKEPAVVFPPFYFGQIYEARCFPGTVTLRPALLLELLTGVLDEIGRNGFRKIILYNAHGGNAHLLRFLAQCTLWEEKPYSLYLYARQFTEAQQRRWRGVLESSRHGHACECETSISLANHPDLVKMRKLKGETAEPRARLKGLASAWTGVHWYSDYPEHYAGDARRATRKKGLALRAIEVESLAQHIASVKADRVVPALTREFFERERALRTDEGR